MLLAHSNHIYSYIKLFKLYRLFFIINYTSSSSLLKLIIFQSTSHPYIYLLLLIISYSIIMGCLKLKINSNNTIGVISKYLIINYTLLKQK